MTIDDYRRIHLRARCQLANVSRLLFFDAKRWLFLSG
jgi:hypothetical protein